MLLASINVYMRDTQHLVEVIVGAAWFWACPIVYTYWSTIHQKLIDHHIPTWVYLANPMTPLVMTFQRVLYNRMGVVKLTTTKAHTTIHNHAVLLPPWGAMRYVEMDAMVLGVAVALFFVGMVVFGRLAGNFAEEL
jgi:ABC-2 type transport system permease protein